jgi:hypothetical protein
MLIDRHARPVSEDQLREEQRFVAVGKELESDSPTTCCYRYRCAIWRRSRP